MIRKGIILAGGTGSRLYPLTKCINKHLLSIGKYPMIYHPINTLKSMGVNDILIISGSEHMGTIVSQLGDGKDFNVDFTYKIQDKPDGIAGALRLCKNYINDTDRFPVILGDNIFEKVNIKTNNVMGCNLFLKETEDPKRFGVAEIKDNKIISIEEKPDNPKSNYAITGLYIFDYKLWEILHKIKKSDRGEYEVVDIHKHYMKNNELYYNFVDGFWSDAGTFESLQNANIHMKEVTYNICEQEKIT